MKELLGMKECYTEADIRWATAMCILCAEQSTCKRSKCGSIVVSGEELEKAIIGKGYNSMPCNAEGDCFKDSLPSNFKSDKTCCIHAEQRAIMDALKTRPAEVRGSILFFIRLDENNNPLHAGQPYCTICSKMALDVGIKRFVLWHEEGWTAYDTEYYNKLSFEFKP